MKENILRMKQAIKIKAEEQKIFKPQRKQSFDGKRIVNQQQAANIVRENKYRLRHMYLAYAKLRGKPLETVESKSKEPYSKSLVDKLYEQYVEPVRTDS